MEVRNAILDHNDIRYSELPIFMDSILSKIAVLLSLIVCIPVENART